MQYQFQKLSQYNNITKRPKSDRKSCETEKLQHLWEKLQDLSQVQDQSRNQQMPIFLDDNSVMSRHQENDSFFNTVKILESPGNQIKKQLKTNQQNKCSLNLTSFERQDQIKNNFQNYKKNFVLPVSSQRIIAQNQPYSSSLQYENLQGFCRNNHAVLKQNSKTLLQNSAQNEKYILQQNLSKNKNIPKTNSNSNSIKQNEKMEIQNKNEQNNKNISDMNVKLLQDNKKLFDQCVKLRKMLLSQKSAPPTQPQTKPLSLAYPISNLQTFNIISQDIESKQLQKVKKQNLQNQCLLKQQSDQIFNLQQENSELKQTIRILENQIENQQNQKQTDFINLQHQYQQRLQIIKLEIKSTLQQQIERRFLLRIKQLQERINQKQKQLINSRQFKLQYEYKLKRLQKQRETQQSTIPQLQKQLQRQNIEVSSLKNTISSQLNQLNQLKQLNNQLNQINEQKNKEQQKLSRTNSIKSTSISCSDHNYNLNNKNTKIDQQNTQYYQTLFKDKQRTITNMKIVHESEIKKLKNMIKEIQKTKTSIFQDN